MARDSERRERKDKTEKFQTFNRPKLKIARTVASGKTYIDYKDTESLRKMISGNGKILSQAHRRYCDGAAHGRPRRQTRPVHGIASLRQRGRLIAVLVVRFDQRQRPIHPDRAFSFSPGCWQP